MRKAVYPGTFDPVTNGHLDLIERGSRLFSEVIVLVAGNPGKTPLFTAEERVDLIRTEIAGYENVRVDTAGGLTVDYVRQAGFDTILRGIRTTTDFVSRIPTRSTISPTLTVPRSTRPVATVPRPVIENTSSTGIKNGLSWSRSGMGIYSSNAFINS